MEKSRTPAYETIELHNVLYRGPASHSVSESGELPQSRREEVNNLERLCKGFLEAEIETLLKAVNSSGSATPADMQNAFRTFLANASSVQAVEGYIAKKRAELTNFEKGDATGLIGIADWANDAWNANQYLITAVVAVSMVGVNVTYPSMVSATRGNIDRMCWSFSFFMMGLASSTMVQLVLLWATQLRKSTVSTVSVCELLVGIGLYGAIGFVISGTFALVLSVLRLDPQKDTHPRPSAILAIGIMTTCAFIVLVTFLLVLKVEGLQAFLRRTVSKPGISLQDYPKSDATKRHGALDPGSTNHSPNATIASTGVSHAVPLPV